MQKLTKHLETKGMSIFWQIFTLCLVISSLIPILFFNKDNLVSGFFLTISPLYMVGLIAAIFSHEDYCIPLVILSVGVALAGAGDAVQHFIHFNAPIPDYVSIILKELGILLFMLFGFLHVLMFEKKFNIKGFTIDYILLVLSAVFLILLISPNLISTLVHQLNFNQQLSVFNFFLGIVILTLSLIHYFFTKSMSFTDGLRVLLTVLLVSHFGLNVFTSFDIGADKGFIDVVSISLFYLSGALAIGFIFIEELSLEYSSIAPNRMGSLFMWVSSIFAILAIPFAMIVRSMMDAPPLDLLVIGVTSFLISSIVIWRLKVLVKVSNYQREKLDALIKTNPRTGLANYQGYIEQLTISKLKNILVVNINIEDFKSINDLYGSEAGNEILRNLAEKLEKLPNSLLAAHIHSDQFLVVFQTKRSNIFTLIEKLQKDLGIWANVKGKQIAVPLKMGGCFSEDINPEQLANHAEIAQKASRKEDSSFALYSEEENRNKIPRNELRQILQQSVDDSYLPVHFQPIYNLSDG